METSSSLETYIRLQRTTLWYISDLPQGMLEEPKILQDMYNKDYNNMYFWIIKQLFH
jgi:hypothetical protein